ncbi:hypothetical protein BDR05DRAFT_1000151 [Suillus weaverae]|nr:hypothetical protein BDR05DRAFT_1000151 [Suillus weaverae]
MGTIIITSTNGTKVEDIPHTSADASELPEIIYETSPSDLHVPPIEELATQKEAHAFTQMAQAEHKLEYTHLHTSPHLSLDNRRQSHANNCGRG